MGGWLVIISGGGEKGIERCVYYVHTYIITQICVCSAAKQANKQAKTYVDGAGRLAAHVVDGVLVAQPVRACVWGYLVLID
jgi:hypothetical protein